MQQGLGDILTYGGYVIAVIVAMLAYHVGRARGANAANRWWENWLGVTADDLESHQFDRQLRDFRRHIGRPADEWPELARED
ncbi:MAG: hypothetical protein JSV65_16240 [Armatimonadota bacterium]|nr:MAG: hypothetical protein JSV65_16240 [Armatimonadota bacterium]